MKLSCLSYYVSSRSSSNSPKAPCSPAIVIQVTVTATSATCSTARAAAENARYENLYARGHNDFGSLTLLFAQPVAALQVKTPSGQWKYVKPQPGSITVNIADALQFWTNGFLKSSVHRVVTPPEDQAGIDRLGVMYFVRPGDHLDLRTVDSPLLRREGFYTEEEGEREIRAEEWVRARVRKNWDKPPVDRGENISVGGVQARIFHE